MDMKTSVSNEELLALTKKAFDNDEVAEFLCGENGYAIHGNRDIPLIFLPTLAELLREEYINYTIVLKIQLLYQKPNPLYCG